MRRKVATAALPQVPVWVYSFDRRAWWDAGQPVPADVVDEAQIHAGHNNSDPSVGAFFVHCWRTRQAQARWHAAAERWCLEHGLPDTIIGFGENWAVKFS